MGDKYDATQPSKFNLYNDCTALYGWAMKQYLPKRAYTWLDKHTTAHWVNVVRNMERHQSNLQKELFETRMAQFREAHKDDMFPEEWGLKTNGKRSPVAGLTFAEAEQNDKYVSYALSQDPEAGSTLYLFKQFVTTDWHVDARRAFGMT